MESSGSNEFLLGIEEYLANLGCRDQAVQVHSLAMALGHQETKAEVIKLYFQDCCSYLTKQGKIHLADLVHKFNKAKDPIEYKDAVLAYMIQMNEVITVHATDLVHKLLKLKVEESAKDALLIYIMNQYVNDQPLKDFIFKTTKQLNQNEYHRALLQFLATQLEDKSLCSLAHRLNSPNDDQRFIPDFVRTNIANLELEFPSDKFFRGINSCIKNGYLDQDVINDAFSRSQIKSKFWLIKELEKIQKHYVNVLVLAGWFGQTKSIYEKFCTYQKMRILDLDRNACEVSDYVFNLSNLENHKVKSISADINNLVLHKNGYEWTVENFKEPEKNYSEKFLPNLIINTSAEHMTEEWFHQIRFKQLESNPIVAIQSNNMFGIDEHVNCVHSIDHMKKKFPMKEVLYEGELQLKGYKRVMLIGRP